MTIEGWIGSQGGLGADLDRQAQVDRVSGPIAADYRGAPIRVRVLASSAVAAYGWRGGRLFVTRGLVDLLDDQELTAAIAHEVGHLLDDGNLTVVTGLRGCGAGPGLEAEARADRLGVGLLQRLHAPPQVMARMLAKVQRAAAALPPECRDALGRRIELLRATP